MKTRKGFVSNSSSSSFVVSFSPVPRCAEEMKKMLFGDKDVYSNPYWEYSRTETPSWPTTLVAETVFGDLENQPRPLTTDEIVEQLLSGWFAGMPEFSWDDPNRPKWSEDGYEECYDKEDKEIKAVAKEIVKKFFEDNPEHLFYKFEYSDNDSDYFCALEHGNLFDRLPHITISHH